MTVPRESSPLMLFNQTSLAIQLKPRAQPVMNLKTSQRDQWRLKSEDQADP
jgi:hypothetical protein